MQRLLVLGALAFEAVHCLAALSVNARLAPGSQAINLWKLQQRVQPTPSIFSIQGDPKQLFPAPTAFAEFPVYTFTQPLDHFFNTTNATFEQRYWVSKRHYKPGTRAPVIVLDGGEANGEDRLPFLDTGIVDILANATGGVGVVLEHRYYGA